MIRRRGWDHRRHCSEGTATRGRTRHRDDGPAQGLPGPTRPSPRRGRRPRPRRPGRRRPRLPRAQRLRQDHHHPDAAGAGPGDVRVDAPVRHRGAALPAAGDRPDRGGRGVAQVLAQLLRPPEPAPAGPHPRRAPVPGGRGRRDRRADRARPRPLQVLLARHEAAPRHRGHPAQGPGPADPRRADQRPRPRRHPRDPRHHPRPVRLRRHRAPELPHPGRGAAGVHLGHDHRQRADARVGNRRRPAALRGGVVPGGGLRPGRRAARARPTPASRHSQAGDRLLVESDRPGADISRALAAHDLWVDELVPVRAGPRVVLPRAHRQRHARRPEPTEVVG